MRTTHAIAGIAAFALLAGCQGHGKHTQAFKEQAEGRMSAVKAATQWDMAHQQFLAGDLDKALRTVNTSIAMHDQVAKSHMLKGRILLELDSLEPALASLATAIELQPDNAEPHYYCGIVHERLSDAEDALKAYNTASTLDPQNPQYVLAAAEMEILLDRLDDASRRLSVASSTFEHNAGIRQTLGHIAMMRGETHDAVRHFEEACLLGPDDPGLLEDLSRAQLTVGDYAGAEYTLRRLLRESSNTEDVERMLARCLIALERPVEARDLLIKRVNTDAGNSDVESWIDLGGVCLQIGDRFRLRQAGTRVTAMAPERVDGYMLTAWWHHIEGRHEDALKVLDRGARVTKQVSDVAILQSLILREMGESDRAVRVLTRARQADPNNELLARVMADINAERAVADVPID
ncbi:MAG: hypothetical protein Tsb0013_02780 [Phycisphaerales bacterium]